MKSTFKGQPDFRFSDFLLSFWCGTAGWFTVLSLGLLISGFFVGESGQSTVAVRRFLLLLPCGCCLSVARLIRLSDLRPALRILLHYFITLLSLFLFLWLPTRNAAFSRSVVFLLIVTVLYTVIRLIFHFILSAIKKRKNG